MIQHTMASQIPSLEIVEGVQALVLSLWMERLISV